MGGVVSIEIWGLRVRSCVCVDMSDGGDGGCMNFGRKGEICWIFVENYWYYCFMYLLSLFLSFKFVNEKEILFEVLGFGLVCF